MRWCLLFVVVPILSGCLYSTHHFNHGKVPEPGQTRFALGAGRQPLWDCRFSAAGDSSLCHTQANQAEPATGEPDTVVTSLLPKGSFHFELGLFESPLGGIALGWHLEGPTNPLSMEFEAKLGLPSPWKTWDHNTVLGWGVGFWADNSVFLEYGAGYSLSNFRFFGNGRGTWLATQVGQVLADDLTGPLPKNQKLIFQSGVGLRYTLPRWPVLPHTVIAMVHATYPQLPTGKTDYRAADISPLLWDVNLGMEWEY